MISLFALSKATLRVIGLATVMQGNPGIDVVMPPVPEHIEEHVPVLIVRNNEIVGPTTGWKTGAFSNGFTYVVLTGEDVQFLPDAANPAARVPSQLPRLTNGCIWKLTSQPLGVFAGASGVSNQLRPPLLEGYRPPIYKDAAAVLRVPYGSTSACKAFVKKQKLTRIDTNVVWNTNGGVTIVGKHHETRLRLEGTSVLIVAGNVPESLLNGSIDMDIGHFSAYFTMLVPNGRKGCFREGPAANIPRCPDSTRTFQGVAPPVPDVIFIVTSECSNSQYP